MSAQKLLDSFEWNSRPVLVFGSSEADDQASAQLDSLRSMSDSLASRDSVLLFVQGDRVLVQSPREVSVDVKAKTNGEAALADDLRALFKVNKDSFTLLLIGKDGSVKRRSETFVDAEILFSQIDSMPMRQSEMSRSRD